MTKSGGFKSVGFENKNVYLRATACASGKTTTVLEVLGGGGGAGEHAHLLLPTVHPLAFSAAFRLSALFNT